MLGLAQSRCTDVKAHARFENGGRVAAFTLYQSGTWPRGMIGPVELFWQSPTSTPSPRRTIWLRFHPSIFEEAYSAIKASIANHVVQRVAAEDVVQMRDLRGEINAFEIMGPNAARVLRGVMTLCKGVKGAKRQVGDVEATLTTVLGRIAVARNRRKCPTRARSIIASVRPQIEVRGRQAELTVAFLPKMYIAK